MKLLCFGGPKTLHDLLRIPFIICYITIFLQVKILFMVQSCDVADKVGVTTAFLLTFLSTAAHPNATIRCLPMEEDTSEFLSTKFDCRH